MEKTINTQSKIDDHKSSKQDQITVSRGINETLIRIGSTTFLAEMDAFDRFLEYAYILHHVRANSGITQSDLPKSDTCTVEGDRDDQYEAVQPVKKPPAEALEKVKNRSSIRDYKTAAAIQEAYRDWGESSIAMLFGIAYEWGRINGKKERRRASKNKQTKEA